MWIIQSCFHLPHRRRFPTRQLFFLALCRLTEPIAFMSIFPYGYQMVEILAKTDDRAQLAMYAGMLISSFAFAECLTGVVWGHISDMYGRKLVLIMGLVGTFFSMISFGFATSLPAAIAARALGGLLNRNVGVLQTTVAELVVFEEDKALAYSIMPFMWSLGSVIGPTIGGALAMPRETYPRLFSRDSIFDRFPFLFPNLLCCDFLVFGITVGILFVKETHEKFKDRRDWGCEVGEWVLAKVGLGHTTEYTECNTEEEHLIQTTTSPAYETTEHDLLDGREMEAGSTDIKDDIAVQTFNRQVILLIIIYSLLAFHSISFDSLMPYLLSEPLADSKPSLPFRFSGGFALTTKDIGFMMAIQAGYSMFAQLWLFPFVISRVGTLVAFRWISSIWIVLYLVVPYLVFLPPKHQTAGIYFCLLTKITFHVIAFPAIAILIANAAPSKLVLGTINGMAAAAACFARGCGPIVTGAIHSTGLKYGYNGLAWWVAGLVCTLGVIVSLCVKETTEMKGTICRRR